MSFAQRKYLCGYEIALIVCFRLYCVVCQLFVFVVFSFYDFLFLIYIIGVISIEDYRIV